MVPVVIRALALLVLCASAARASVDLTPTDTVQLMETMKVHRIVFHDGAKQILYQAPKGWSCNGSSSSAVLSIPQHPAARASINDAAHLRIPALDDKSAKQFYKDPTLLQLPKDSKDVKVNSVVLNPLVVDGHPTLEVQVTYSYYGQSCARSILLIDRNGEEISCVLDCLAPDFDALHKLFAGSFYSFENL